MKGFSSGKRVGSVVSIAYGSTAPYPVDGFHFPLPPTPVRAKPCKIWSPVALGHRCIDSARDAATTGVA